MIVECIALLPTLPQSVRLGTAYRAGDQEFPLEVGRRYDVFGLRQIGSGSWVYIMTVSRYLVLVPLCLFAVLDSQVPSDWEVSVDEEGDLLISFAEMRDPYFADDLASGDSSAMLALARFERELARRVAKGAPSEKQSAAP